MISIGMRGTARHGKMPYSAKGTEKTLLSAAPPRERMASQRAHMLDLGSSPIIFRAK
jgi:hypothetical protein